ncbi:MAG: hypothetical protein WBW73_27525, partial [Rhodoplanes sp.]
PWCVSGAAGAKGMCRARGVIEGDAGIKLRKYLLQREKSLLALFADSLRCNGASAAGADRPWPGWHRHGSP